MKARLRGIRSPVATASADYSFRQSFGVNAAKAFRWCIDFTPYDWADSGGHGSRKVVWVSSRTVLLDDVFPAPKGRRIRKVKMVQIYPETRSWVSTHVVGPNRHSQFRYRIVPEGPNRSALVFEGRELRWKGPRLRAAANRQLAQRLCKADSSLWKRLAVELERDYHVR